MTTDHFVSPVVERPASDRRDHARGGTDRLLDPGRLGGGGDDERGTAHAGRKVCGHNVITGHRIRSHPELLGLRQPDPSSQQAGGQDREDRDRDR